jgi:hypothetical protein
MSAPVREARFRLPWSNVADWVILDHARGKAHVYSNTLNTDAFIVIDSLIAVDRGESSPLPLTVADPSSIGASSTAGSALSVRACSPAPGHLPQARNTDPDTAHAAAARAAGGAAASRVRVLIAHRDAGEHGLTGWELEQALKVPYESCGPRRPGLEADGLIYVTGEKRPNDRGNMQRVYAVTEAGRVEAARAVA